MKSLVVVLSAVVVALALIAIHQTKEANAGRLQLQTLQTTVSPLSKSPQSVTTTSLQLHSADGDGPGGVAASGSDTAPQSLPSVTSTPAQRESVIDGLLTSPENVERTHDVLRARLPQKYPELGKALGLSQDALNRLYDLIAQQDVRGLAEVKSQRGSEGVSTHSPLDRLQRNEAEISELLGNKYEKWKEYKAELPSRQQVRDLRSVLQANSMPLGEAEAQSLLSALSIAQKRIYEDQSIAMQRGGGKSTANSRFSDDNNRKLLDAAGPYLTPQQLEAYRKMLERKHDMERTLLPP